MYCAQFNFVIAIGPLADPQVVMVNVAFSDNPKLIGGGMMRKKLMIGLAAAGLIFFGCAANNQALGPQHVGGTAEDFTLQDQNDESVTLSGMLEGRRGAVIAFYPKDDTTN